MAGASPSGPAQISLARLVLVLTAAPAAHILVYGVLALILPGLWIK